MCIYLMNKGTNGNGGCFSPSLQACFNGAICGVNYKYCDQGNQKIILFRLNCFGSI